MPRIAALSLSFFVVAFGVRASSAQQPAVDLRRDHAASVQATTGAVLATPEMWFYEQERGRYDDPKLAVRRRAEQRANERHQRLAAMQWFGYSNSRPVVGVNPMYGDYGTYWGSNTYEPSRWRLPQSPLVVLRPSDVPY